MHRIGKCRPACLIGLLATAIFLGPACDRHPTDAAEPDEGPRIVSLSPALTQMVIDIGLGERVVGRSSYDDLAPSDAAVVGHLFQLDYEKLLLLEPTHVLIQAGRDGVPARLTEMADAHGWAVHNYDIDSVAQVYRALIGDGEVVGVGEALGRADRAERVTARMRAKLRDIRTRPTDGTRPRALLLVGADPIIAAGRGTFLSELLTIAGGENAAPEAMGAYPTLDKEAVQTLAPEVVVLFGRSDRPSAATAEAVGVDPLTTRVVVIDDPAALKPTTTLPRTAAQLHLLLHPPTNAP